MKEKEGRRETWKGIEMGNRFGGRIGQRWYFYLKLESERSREEGKNEKIQEREKK